MRNLIWNVGVNGSLFTFRVQKRDNTWPNEANHLERGSSFVWTEFFKELLFMSCPAVIIDTFGPFVSFFSLKSRFAIISSGRLRRNMTRSCSSCQFITMESIAKSRDDILRDKVTFGVQMRRLIKCYISYCSVVTKFGIFHVWKINCKMDHYEWTNLFEQSLKEIGDFFNIKSF